MNYNEELKKLKNNGPENLYVLSGPEVYLRDLYLGELKKMCLPEGDGGFGYFRFSGYDESAVRAAMDTLPFMTERTFIEIHDVDKIPKIESIPDYCTVCFIHPGSLKNSLCFDEQSPAALSSWIKKRFSALGKRIDENACQRLIFVSGGLMSRLIPEIEKIANYASGELVTVSDVDAAAVRIPEAAVFDMVGSLSAGKNEAALRIFYDLIRSTDNSPMSILSALSYQFRQLYIVKCGYISVLNIRSDYAVKKLKANTFSKNKCAFAVNTLAECEYRIKTSAAADTELLKDALIRIIAYRD